MTHLSARRSPVKNNNSTEYFRFRPISYHVGKTIWILFIEMIHCIRESRGRLLRHALSWVDIRSIPPGFIQSMLMHAVI